MEFGTASRILRFAKEDINGLKMRRKKLRLVVQPAPAPRTSRIYIHFHIVLLCSCRVDPWSCSPRPRYSINRCSFHNVRDNSQTIQSIAQQRPMKKIQVNLQISAVMIPSSCIIWRYRKCCPQQVQVNVCVVRPAITSRYPATAPYNRFDL